MPSYTPGQSWHLWAPPSHSTPSSPIRNDAFNQFEADQVVVSNESPAFFNPNPSRNNSNWSRLENPSPLRSNSAADGGSPLRNKMANPMDEDFLGSFGGTKASPVYLDQELGQDDELRMKALLNAALDSREDLFPSPVPRAASTPPSRLFSNSRPQNPSDLAFSIKNLDINDVS